MGLVVFAVMGAYLLLSIGVTVWAVRYARKHEKNVKLWGFGAAFIMYNLVFWDWIPTVVAHKYYCSTEAGFWVYKTVEQWKAENPGVVESLVTFEGSQTDRVGDMNNYMHTYHRNQRFNWIVKHNGKFFPNRWKHEQEVVDTKTGEVLARYIDFSTSQERRQAGWSGWKMWLDNRNCNGGKINQSHFWRYEDGLFGRKR
ncbi:hypothetical protein ACFL19_00785 [Pseudomonadota bacterium]